MSSKVGRLEGKMRHFKVKSILLLPSDLESYQERNLVTPFVRSRYF
jgi:hypothetical protein